MSDDLIFRLYLAALLVAFVAHRAYYTRKVQHSAETIVEQPEQGSLTQFSGLLAVLALLGTVVYFIFPAWMAWASLPLPVWLRWLGLGIAVSGFGLLQWAQVSLGENWSDDPVLVKGQELVTGGPYRRVRHPIYTAFLLILGSILFISANWFIGAAWIGMTALDAAARVKVEEAMLLAQFGEPYRAYLRRTRRFLPRIGRKVE